MEKNLAIANAIQNDAHTPTFDEVLSAKKTAIESAISAFNASTKPATEHIRIKNLCADLDTFVRDTRLKGFQKAFHTLDRVMFMRLFLNERAYTGYRIAQNQKTGALSLKETDRAITEKVMRTFLNKKDENSVAPATTYEIAANATFWKHLPMFYDNVLRYMAENVGTIAPKMNEDAMKQYSKEYREKEGYPVATSLTKLSEQLNALVKEFLPEGLEIPMNSFDVKALAVSLNNRVKRMKFDLSNSDILLDNILFALEIRMNGKRYEITSRDKNHKESK